jgi:hypothetical protein
MSLTLGSLLEERTRTLVGRDRERAALLGLVQEDRPLVAAVHGIAGVGKTSLLQAFAADARAAAAAPVLLDARAFEPTERGFLAAVAVAIDAEQAPAGATAAALGALGDRVVLVIDTYELLGLLDAWLSETFVPALPANVRVLLAGRTRPSTGWVHGYGELLATVRLGNLPPYDAESILRRAGVDPAVNRVAHGHPLTLQLAASALRDRPAAALDDAAIDVVVEQLGRHYLDQLDARTRRVLGAASVTRRTTLSLLEAMLPDESPWEAFELLRRLPFVELGADGLVVHDTMHAVTAAVLRAADPAAHRRYRMAAWACLHRELRQAPQRELWRYTADMLFLVDNPMVRQFFFPAMALDQSVEPARDADWPAIAAIAAAAAHVLPMDHVEDWWHAVPEAFAVTRDPDGGVTGFRCLAERDQVSTVLMRHDPLAARWREHLRRDPVPRGHRVLFLRYLATTGAPMTPSNAVAALLLDLKRTYFAMRPELRRTYVPEPLLAGAEGGCALTLGYAPLPGEARELDASQRSLYNDFGPGSIDGWLADLAARELLVEDAGAVDSVRRELRLDGERIDLTQLEFDVLRYLQQREGEAVEREALLRDVWGYEWTGGSNVVEVAISTLRKKLGERARALRTVRGIGYRLDPLT